MKSYWAKFGSGNASDNTGLTPTFTIFSVQGLTAISAPGITETPSGSGLYKFQYDPTLPIIFALDGGAALDSTARYVYGVLDPIQAVDEKVGTLSDSYGTTAIDPQSVLGYLKRNQEFQEGNATFTKSTGTWNIYTRGSSALLREKTLANNTTEASKT